MDTIRSKSSFDALPFELLQEICGYLELDDIASFRLITAACSVIGMSFMLRTLRFSGTLDGIARLQVVSESPIFARLVHKLEFDLQSHGLEPNSRNVAVESALKRKHKFTLKELVLKYTRLATSFQDRDEGLLGTTSQHDGHEGNPLCQDDRSDLEMTPYLKKMIKAKSPTLIDVISACILRLPNLQDISARAAGLTYLWTSPTELSINQDARSKAIDLGSYTPAYWLIKDFALFENVESVRFNVNLTRVGMGLRKGLFGEKIEWSLPNLKQLSLILPNDTDPNDTDHSFDPNDHSKLDRPLGPVSQVCSAFEYRIPKLEYLEIKVPCHHASNNYLCRPYCQSLQCLPNICFPEFKNMRRLKLGYIYLDVACRLNTILRYHNATLRELSLTRIDIGKGSLANVLAYLRYNGYYLEVLELHDVFRESGKDQIVDMDQAMKAEDWVKFEEEDRQAICTECGDESRTVGYHTSKLILTQSSHIVRKRARFIMEWIEKMMK